MKFTALLLTLALSLISVLAFAEDMSKSTMTDAQKMMVMHKTMGMMHSKMMSCMESGKSTDDCHSMMLKECKMPSDMCPKMLSVIDESTTKMMGMMSDADMMAMADKKMMKKMKSH
jgi:CBS-domain-containing membrane protein